MLLPRPELVTASSARPPPTPAYRLRPARRLGFDLTLTNGGDSRWGQALKLPDFVPLPCKLCAMARALRLPLPAALAHDQARGLPRSRNPPSPSCLVPRHRPKAPGSRARLLVGLAAMPLPTDKQAQIGPPAALRTTDHPGARRWEAPLGSDRFTRRLAKLPASGLDLSLFERVV